MKENYTETVCIIDRSGSMAVIQDDAIGGFNTFLAEQKKVPGEKDTLTLVQFDDQYEVIHENKPLSEVPDLTRETFVPRGTTALLDAIGRTISTVGKRLSRLEPTKRPDKVIVAILTDGHENASRKFRRENIFDMITHQKEKYSWEFIFLAANQDAIQAGMSMGVAVGDSFNFAGTGAGVRDGYKKMSATVSVYRGVDNNE
ncbi:MAG: VWA domain-containing protein [bacterium]|nr:VWA domain-containing protein [bacterium]